MPIPWQTHCVHDQYEDVFHFRKLEICWVRCRYCVEEFGKLKEHYLHRDLEKEVQEGNFRQDLFYRINVIKITLPPLREKLEDIRDLLTFFLKKHSPEGQPVKKPGKGLVSHLMSYSWPGNIRELENSVERAIVLSDEEELLLDAFPFETSQAHIELNVGSALKKASDLFRQTFISNTLKSTSGNRTKAAQILDVQCSYLSRLIKELGIK